jgi:hypothetical protein
MQEVCGDHGSVRIGCQDKLFPSMPVDDLQDFGEQFFFRLDFSGDASADGHYFYCNDANVTAGSFRAGAIQLGEEIDVCIQAYPDAMDVEKGLSRL